MATYYVDSNAGGAGTGADWANAYTTLAAAVSGKSAGDVFYIAHNHAESSASNITIASPGTAASPCLFICVNSAGSVPPVSADLRTTATVSTTGNATITINGALSYWYGVIFTVGNSTGSPSLNISGGNSGAHIYQSCSLRIGSTGAGVISIGSQGAVQAAYAELINCTASFSGVGQSFNVTGFLRWRDTASALIGTAVPGALFVFSAGRAGRIDCSGVDLSAAGTGKTLVSNTTGATAVKADFRDCKIDNAVTLTAVPGGAGTINSDFVRVSGSGINYSFARSNYMGSMQHETTVVRTGGASDGTTPIAWKIDTTANCTDKLPFQAPPIGIWNDTTGLAVTATVEGVWGGGAVPNNDQIWMEVEYLGSASDPQASRASNGKTDILAAASALASSTETWGGSTTKFKLAASFTPQQKGWIFARVMCAKASDTFYIDPKITLS